MAKIAFILLCHKDPQAIIQQAERLTAAGDCLAIHFDARAPLSAFEQIKTALHGNPNVTFAAKRIKCGWGEWSLVDATLSAIEAAVTAFPKATHFYMVSGDCMPIKSAAYLHDLLDAADVDYIESFDYFESNWIKTGFREERLIYRHWFNERTHKWWFYTSFNLQKRFGLTRKIPQDVAMMIGSQWWCLRRRTIEAVLEFRKTRRDVMRFFQTTWIPDETFFQTIVRHLVPSNEIQSRTLTFLMFTDYGMPLTFYNDHYDLLLGQEAVFARKISPEADDLKTRLGALYASGQREFVISNEGRNLFGFLTSRGRIGRRFGQRFWEQGTTLGRDRTLFILTCKKWHVAKRLASAINYETGIPMLDFVFDEEGSDLPDLGGAQSTLDKRGRHRRALIRMMFEHYETDQLGICLDPRNFDLLQDLARDRATVKILEISCDFSYDYLEGHAKRVGLASDASPVQTITALIPTLQNDVAYESERIRDAGFANFTRMIQAAPLAENVAAIVRFLAVPEDVAQALVETPHLFVD
ncbi:MAG: DUF5928 domain-containing protein [Pseudomonadota bacterium]